MTANVVIFDALVGSRYVLQNMTFKHLLENLVI